MKMKESQWIIIRITITSLSSLLAITSESMISIEEKSNRLISAEDLKIVEANQESLENYLLIVMALKWQSC